MENRPFPLPTGEAFIVRTPYLDKVANDLRKEELQRQAQYNANSKALDDDFLKNVAGIRDADVPQLVSKYGDYKNLWKQLNKKGSSISPEQQLELLRKKADILTHISKSKQEKENEELAVKDLTKNPNNFEGNAHQFLIERRKLPVTQMQVDVPNPMGKSFKMDMSDIYGNILYRGNNTDFTPVLKKAEGQLQPRGKTIEVKSPDGLTTTLTTFKAPNSTSEYLELLHNGVKGSRGERDFLMKHQYDDNEAQQIIDNYTKLRQTPEFQNAYPNEPEIPASMMLTPLGRSMALASMEHSITHPPVAIIGKPFNNTGAVMDKRREEGMADWKIKNQITNQQKKERIQLNNSGRVYTIENVPLSVRNNSYTEPSVYGDYQVSDATKLSEGQMEDIFGKKGGKFGERPYKPIETNGKKLIKVLPEGLEVRDADGNPVIIKDNDIIVNTNKRTVSLEKPVGTGKAKIRTTTPANKVGALNDL